MTDRERTTQSLAAALANAMPPAPIAAIGIDVVDIDAFERDITYAGDSMLELCFSQSERMYCAGDKNKLAARFALKEATLKALGTGIRGIGLRDVSISTSAAGKPEINLSANARAVAAAAKLGTLRCSATRESGFAVAVVVASEPPKENTHA